MSQGLNLAGVAIFGGFGLRGGMTKESKNDLDETKRLIGALVRMPLSQRSLPQI